ncbi:DUF3889 domain-containing protein [Bacillus sp. 03113]|uniref:DUF3889 domain-containing protein n=1 Tax=Bacillus sp. 03113 TaxID=2578211 RepID=UPI001144061F|nr:DUF3889 domain-containing protein [Bacillus sp. 03113]
MRKLFICLFVTLVFCSESVIPLDLFNKAYARQEEAPPYAKWGSFALKKTKEKYPNAKIIDYLHVGKISGPITSTERFKFWLKENGKEYGVIINIEFNNETERVKRVTFKKTQN